MSEIELEQEQYKLELQSIEEAKHKIAMGFITTIEQERFSETTLGQSLIKISMDSVTSNIKQYFKADLRGDHRKNREKLKLFFEGREEQLAYIILNSMLSKVSKYSIGIVNMARLVLLDINNVLSVEKLKENDPKVYSFLEYEYKHKGPAFINKRKKKLAMIKGFDTDNIEVTTKTGTELLNCVLSSGTDIFETFQQGFKKPRRIIFSDKAIKFISKNHNRSLDVMFTFKPLVIKPVPHTKLFGSGGYLIQKGIPLIKGKKKNLSIIEDDFNKCDRMLSLLNRVQDIEWCVNTRVLDVMSYIIDNDLIDPKSSATNPKLYGDMPIFKELNIDDMVPKYKYGAIGTDGRFIDDLNYKRWFADKQAQELVNDKIIGRRLNYIFAIDTAKQFMKYDKFYYTYQFDYRYRLYPLQQHLNPQQTGNIKALLQFYNGQVLNEEGLYWFKVHGANCFGLDKAPYDDRVAWVDANIDMIQRVAANPLDTLNDWADADSAFEFLAFCFSMDDYLKDNNVKIHIPVALDATCSGLQLYSGLLRDREGAEAVNVIGKTRNDVYEKVADVGNKLLDNGTYLKSLTFTTKDGEEKTIDTTLEASSLKGKISRRLTKRNVMTTPYSVTQRGMYDQVKELLSEDEINGNVWWKGDRWVVAKLISDLNATAISHVVKGASKGQEYIKNITENICSKNEYMSWLSPVFKLPMLQRIPKEKIKRIRTPFGSLALRIATDRVNGQKMLSSIAPNFIHQLDASLMYRTVEKCMEDGVKNFWLIHDSYAVLPNDVPSLNKNVREAYVELFSRDILKEWVEQLGLEFDNSIMINDLDLTEVLESEYIFS